MTAQTIDEVVARLQDLDATLPPPTVCGGLTASTSM